SSGPLLSETRRTIVRLLVVFVCVDQFASLDAVDFEQVGDLAFAQQAALPGFGSHQVEAKGNCPFGIAGARVEFWGIADYLVDLFLGDAAIAHEPVPGAL